MASLGDKFKVFTAMTYAQQGQAFLNAYWKEHSKSAEQVWQWANKFAELDIEKKKQGSDLDEFNAHRFLEGIGSTKRVVELRDELRAIDLDFNKRMAAIEFFLFHFKCKVEDFVSRPQGDNSEELAKAQKLLDEAQKALDEAIKKAGEAKAALDEVKALEAARDKKTQELTAKGEDMNLGVVARNKAKNELAQHLAEDPLPLRKAKITLEAANKAANKAVDQAEAKLAEAQTFLDKVKTESSGGVAQGNLWWLDRELTEKKKYLPKRLQ